MNGWVKHESSSRVAINPKLSIRGDTQLGFNFSAYDKFKLGNVKYVELYFNSELKAIGVKPVSSEGKGVKILRHGKRGGNYISAKKFIYDYELHKLENKRLDCEWSDDMKMVIAKIK